MGRNYLRLLFLFGLLSAAGALWAQSAQQSTPQNNSQGAQDQNASDQNSSDQGASDQGASDQNAAPAPTPPPTPAPTHKYFLVNGRSVNAEVVVVDGRSYVDIDSLAQIADITNGTMTVEPTRITLNIPVESPGGAAPAGSNAQVQNEPPASAQGFSKGFISNAINALAEMREWRGATSTMVTYGLAMSEAWAQGYQSRAQDNLAQAMLAATTDDDHNALNLLQNEFSTLSSWSAQVLANRQALNGATTIDPNTLANDTTLVKINTCGDFLSGMLLSGMFNDNASCH